MSSPRARTWSLLLPALALVFTSSATLPAATIVILTGEVVDLVCLKEKGEAGKGPAHEACAVRCAREGKPMGLLTADALYVIEGDFTARSNQKLVDFAGRTVIAKGTVSERDGQKRLNVWAMNVPLAKKLKKQREQP